MKTYIVTQEGVYRHNVYGPFFVYEDARAKADGLAREDQDSYHTYCVWPLDGELGSRWDFAPIYEVKKEEVKA